MTLLAELRSPHATTYRRFLDHWFGEPAAGIHPPDDALSSAIPTVLRSFYGDLTGRTDVFGFNYLYEPQELRPGEDGRIAFCCENQGVCVWAVDADSGSDPAVYLQWANDSDGAPWQREGEPLSRFLLQLVLFEAAMCAPFGGSAVEQSPAAVELILGPLVCLPLEPWHWPVDGVRFWAGEDVVAVVSPSGSETHDVVIGARNVAAIAHLHGLPADSWEALVVRGLDGAAGEGSTP